MSDSLVEINRKDWPILKNLYNKNNPTSDIAYMIIDNYIRWLEQDSNLKHIKFYCLNGSLTHGTFIVIDRCAAYANTLSESTDELFRLLFLVDFSKGMFFNCLGERIASVICDVFKQKNIEILYKGCHLLYHLPKEDALKFSEQSTDGIELRRVTKSSDIEKAYSVWPFASQTSIQYLERAAKYSLNVGAFNADGTLVSWIFRFPSGLIMALQTDADYYGHGYAKLVTKVMSKKIAEMGHEVYAGIHEGNAASKSLFQKLGFSLVSNVYSVSIKIQWSEDDE